MSELQKTYADFALPPSVVSKIDVSRLVSEVERLDGELTTMAVRAKAGAAGGATSHFAAAGRFCR